MGAELPLDVPVPETRPDRSDLPSDASEPAEAKPAAEPAAEDETGGAEQKQEAEIPPPIEAEDPESHAACIAGLREIGAEFTEEERVDEGDGCGMDRPLTLKSLGGDVALSPPGKMRCRTAVNLARWTRDVVKPMLKKAQPAEDLVAINQASAYLCRKRNGADTGKISEHARGNAVDIAGFTFKSGETFTISPREEDSTLNGAFQRAIASSACLYFSTVLDPGSDKAHETHLHLDMLERKGGYRYCW